MMAVFDRTRSYCQHVRKQARQYEQYRLHRFRRWIEHTDTIVHLSVLVFVPLVVGGITWLSGASEQLSFLLFPPIASGAYGLFANPHDRYSSPRRFVGGLTAGAVCGWLALELVSDVLGQAGSGGLTTASGAVLGLVLTGVFTWAIHIEHPSAFSTTLLILITGNAQLLYLLNVLVASTIVAGVFVAWRRYFYDRRARYLYQSVGSDDRVLVPMYGDRAERTALFGARLAAAHSTGRVVLLDVRSGESLAQTEGKARDERTETRTQRPAENSGTAAEQRVLDEAGDRLSETKARIEREIGISCDIAVIAQEAISAPTVLRTARETGCDLIVTPYRDHWNSASYLPRLFSGDIDTIAFRPVREQAEWSRVLVSVRRAGDIAHSMLDFARRLAGDGGVTVSTCIADNSERRGAERMLADLVETVQCPCETHVAQADVGEYLATHSSRYDLVTVGASTDRSAASRLLSRPTFTRLEDIDCDIAVYHEA